MKQLEKTCKKSVSVLLSAVMIISMFTLVPFTAYADDGTFTVLSGNKTVSESIEVNNRITCSDDVALTLADGVTMTVHGGINLTDNATLTINGTGTLMIDSVGENNAGIGGNNGQSLSALTVNGERCR